MSKLKRKLARSMTNAQLPPQYNFKYKLTPSYNLDFPKSLVI